MWQYLITLFRELPDSLKLAIVLCLIVVLIAYTVWQINSWRKQRGLKRQRPRIALGSMVVAILELRLS